MRGWLAAILLLACGATSPLDEDAGALQGVDPPDAASSCERNFYPDEVVCYPTDGLGVRPRVGVDGGATGGSGDRIPNLKLAGWERIDPNYPLDLSNPEGIVPLSDFYDPESRRSTMLMIVGTAAWCNPCIEQTQALVGGWAQQLATQGVRVLQVLDEGMSTAPATLTDLTSWIQTQKPDFSEALPSLGFFAQLETTLTIPYVLYVDARSMEMLEAELGYDVGFSHAQQWASWIAANPPLSSP